MSRGGKRLGAGRKARTGEATTVRAVRLSETESAVLEALTDALGEDSDADTIRAALAALAASHGLAWPSD